MKKYALILAALAASVSSIKADEMAPATASSYSITVDFPYASKYVFRGLEFAEGSFQPSVKVTSGAFYAGLWTNQPLTNNADNEVDLYAGYGYKLNDTWSLDAGATLYYYPELDASSGNPEHTTEAYVGINGSVAGITLGAYVYRDFNLNLYTAQANIGYSIALSDTASLNVGANVGRVTNNGSYTYYGASAAIPFKLNKATTFTVGANYSTHNDSAVVSGFEEDVFWFNTGITVSF